MEQKLNIYIDRLSLGKVEIIQEEIDPSTIAVKDGLLSFTHPIKIGGKAYIADDFLVLNLNISTMYNAFCKICSESIEKSFHMEDIYLTEQISEMQGKVYDALEQIRDTILLEIADYHECEGGCTMREEMEKYFKRSSSEEDFDEKNDLI